MQDIIEQLKEGKHNVEDLGFLNMKKCRVVKSRPAFGKMEIYEVEKEISLEDKIKIIDIFEENTATYLLDIITKWNKEEKSMPKDRWDNPKTVSVKAWIKRNDIKKKIDNDYTIGSYYLFGTKFKSLDIECPSTEHNFNMEYTGEHVANQWFHDLCKKLNKKELEWFKENDPKQIKINKVKALGDSYRIGFNCKLLNDIIYNREENVTDEQLDIFINAYEVLEKCITEQTEKISKTIGKELMYSE
jgi:hypothetical protein